MNIALIGGGGREHALCQKIHESKLTKNIICIPGNPGTRLIAKNIDIDFLDFKKLLIILKLHKIDLVVVGPEEPLVNGIVDFLLNQDEGWVRNDGGLFVPVSYHKNRIGTFSRV